ncbi:MAG: Hg(II)-responsive transcriptional regulator [Gammaproteobacteria bacterium]
MDPALTIGRLAKRAGVNVETIRYYQRIGLISEPPKPGQGYRIYPAETLERIRFVKRAQELGFTLKEIEGLLALSGGGCDDVEALAQQKLEHVRAKIGDLKRLDRVLAQLLRQCRTNPDNTHCPIIETLQPPQK